MQLNSPANTSTATSLDEVQEAAHPENPRKPYSGLLRKEVTELKEQCKILFSILNIDLVKVEQKILLLMTAKVDQEFPLSGPSALITDACLPAGTANGVGPQDPTWSERLQTVMWLQRAPQTAARRVLGLICGNAK